MLTTQTTTATSRNRTNSAQSEAVQSFVNFLEASYPGLTKIRFKKHKRKFVLRVKDGTRTFSASGYTVHNTCRNFLMSYPS